jgi:hypothetical protein
VAEPICGVVYNRTMPSSSALPMNSPALPVLAYMSMLRSGSHSALHLDFLTRLTPVSWVITTLALRRVLRSLRWRGGFQAVSVTNRTADKPATTINPGEQRTRIVDPQAVHIPTSAGTSAQAQVLTAVASANNSGSAMFQV